jgi:hypothetical protein
VKVAVITAAWRRFALTALYWRWTQHLRAWWAPHEVLAITAVSQDRHEELAAAYDGQAVRVPNEPLGRKFNAAMFAARDAGADAVLVMGSDDFLCERTCRALLARCEAGVPYLGLADLYFMHLGTSQVRYWSGYLGARRGEPAGPGRLYRAELLDRVDPPWELWQDHRHAGMDHMSMQRAAAVAPPELLRVRQLDACAVDVKTPEGMHPYDAGYGPTVAARILERLPADLVAGLAALRVPDPRRSPMPPQLTLVRFTKNVCYKGKNYGPDYGNSVVEMPLGDARAFMQQGRAAPAQTDAKALGAGGAVPADVPAAADAKGAARAPAKAPATKGTRKGKGRKKSA